MKNREEYIWVLFRFTLGFIFLWAFFDKLFGLGVPTDADKSWLAGVSPTAGFLKSATHGPFASIFQGIAGSPVVDWLFMMGLFFVGSALILGIGLKIAGYSGALMVFLMWLALFPPKNNPFLDEHIVYLLVFLGLTRVSAGDLWGLGKWWSKLGIVKKYPILK